MNNIFKENIDRVSRLYQDIIRRSTNNGIPLLYFNKVKNVGDLVSVYIVERITGRSTYRVSTTAFRHLTAVGSTLGASSSSSYIWGSGSIDGKAPARKIDPNKIFALRGKRTLALVEGFVGRKVNVPLGDPAVLMPHFYDKSVSCDFEIGIVPHFEEFKLISLLASHKYDSVRVIDVRQDPEVFIDQMRSCKKIISSSLHGLILANAYEIPSMWFSATNFLIGGEWKFLDYYSCTDQRVLSPLRIRDSEDLASAIVTAERRARCHRYANSFIGLRESFPSFFLG